MVSTFHAARNSLKRFALARGKSLSTAVWSDFELIVITEICALDQQGDMTKLYNSIVYYSVIILHCSFKGRYCFQRENLLPDKCKIEHLHKNMLS